MTQPVQASNRLHENAVVTVRWTLFERPQDPPRRPHRKGLAPRHPRHPRHPRPAPEGHHRPDPLGPHTPVSERDQQPTTSSGSGHTRSGEQGTQRPAPCVRPPVAGSRIQRPLCAPEQRLTCGFTVQRWVGWRPAQARAAGAAQSRTSYCPITDQKVGGSNPSGRALLRQTIQAPDQRKRRRGPRSFPLHRGPSGPRRALPEHAVQLSERSHGQDRTTSNRNPTRLFVPQLFGRGYGPRRPARLR
jgi:hypothetical protein